MAALKKYKWNEWFDRPHTILRRGQDYIVSQSTMCGQIRNEASKRGLRVRLIDEWDSITVEVVDAVQNTETAAAIIN